VVTQSNGIKRGQHRRRPLMIEAGAVPKTPRAPRHLGDAGRRWWRSIWRGGGRWLDPATDHLVAEIDCTTIDKITSIEADDTLTKFRNRRHDAHASSKLFLDAIAEAEPLAVE
jgi:hypothetical protein